MRPMQAPSMVLPSSTVFPARRAFFDLPSGSSSQKDGSMVISGSTRVIREDFPQLVKSVIATSWPPVVEDKNCDLPVTIGGEGYSGAQCTGTFLMAPPLPAAPHTTGGEDYSRPPGFYTPAGA